MLTTYHAPLKTRNGLGAPPQAPRPFPQGKPDGAHHDSSGATSTMPHTPPTPSSPPPNHHPTPSTSSPFPPSIEWLWAFWQPLVARCLYTFNTTPQDAEDLTIVTIEKAWANRATFHGDERSAIAWVYTILTNTAIDHFPTLHSHPITHSPSMPASHPNDHANSDHLSFPALSDHNPTDPEARSTTEATALSHLDHNHLAQRTMTILAHPALSDLYRDTLLALYHEHRSYEQLARRHHTTISAIKSTSTRARARFRQLYREAYGEPFQNSTTTNHRDHQTLP